MDVGQLLAQQLGHTLLVPGMEKAPQQADRRGLGVDVAQHLPQRVLVELAQHTVGAGALRHRHPQLIGHERRRMSGAEPVQLGPRLTPQFL